MLYGFDLETSGAIPVLPFLDFVLVWNRGISYGLLQQHEEIGRFGLILFSFVAIIGFLIWLRRIKRGLPALAIGLIIGGALGNAIDRLAYGAVVDFILLHWGDWRWYVFNIADAAIVVAVALLLADRAAMVDVSLFPSRRFGTLPRPALVCVCVILRSA